MIIRIAPRGWDHEAWVGPFYPEDMPANWRLAFFCNEFDTVLVPERQWRALSATELVPWCTECGPRTCFYLERQGGGSSDDREYADALGDHFGGFLTSGAESATMARCDLKEEDLRALRAKIERLAASGSDSVLIIEGDPPSLRVLKAAHTITQLLGISS